MIPSRAHASSWRVLLGVFALAFCLGSALAILVRQPGYMDAYYYYNAAHRLVTGDGLTDPYLWHYLDAPDALPAPSHTYWMPLQSLLAAGAMALGGATFGAAQLPSVLCYAGLVAVTYWLGARLGGSSRTAWISALLVMFSGFFTPFWTTTDTFATFGLAGALALVAAGIGRAQRAARWFAAAGALAGIAHLARADGILLLGIALMMAMWSRKRSDWRVRGACALAALGSYLAVMTPWFLRNLIVLGAPLPASGTATVWLRGYNELVSYPPRVALQTFLDWGPAQIAASRWEAFQANLGTFLAVETWVILGPFVLIGLWRLRRDPIVQAAVWYALGLHLIMTLVFAYPGYRGGLFHSSAALLPTWAVAATAGVERAIAWLGRRRGWRIRQAQAVFGAAQVALAVALSAYVLAVRLPALNRNATFYRTLAEGLPRNARLIVNDPPALYYHTGLTSVVLPDSPPETVLALADRYDLDYLVLDADRTAPFDALFLGESGAPFLELHQAYGRTTADPADDVLVYEIVRPEREAP